MTTSNHLLPRRRNPRHADQALLGIGIKPCSSSTAMPLRKGATFHSPTSPSSSVDPTLNICSLPSRSLTSPKDLEDLVIESQKRVEEIIRDFDRSISLSGESSGRVSLQDVLPVPSVFLAHAASNKTFLDAAAGHKASGKASSKKQSTIARSQTDHDHASDSGLGSSIGSSEYEESLSREQTRGSMSLIGSHQSPIFTNIPKDINTTTSTNTTNSVYTPSRTYSAANKSFSSPRREHSLDQYATTQIQRHIVDPLLEEESFKEYHPLVEDLPNRIASKKITCLRDLEKTLIFLAEFKAKSPASYLGFCNLVIQCLHTAADHLNDIDQRRPTDRPYTNTYFVDLVEQVRQYARIMAITRQKKAQGQALDEMDHKPFVTPNDHVSFADRLLTSIRDEKLKLNLQEGKPVELVRERADGTIISIDGGHKQGSALADDSVIDADMERSMARKRKCDIGKVEYRACRECEQIFTRACDLTKHEKTHSRPWKCPEADCKYHNDGWPTEKERDRHVNDKHLRDAPLFKCLFQPCAYSSKRESNCKQHMEKAHNWEYVRAKSKKGQKLIPSTPATTKLPSETLPTPDSDTAFPSLATPDTTTMSSSPNILSDGNFSPSSEYEAMDESYLAGNEYSSFEPQPLSFEHSMMDSHLTIQQNLALDTTVCYNGLLRSPDCPELANTPGTGYTHSPVNQTFTTTSDIDFDLDGDSPGWRGMQRYFPDWFAGTTQFETNGQFSNMSGGDQQMTHTGYDFSNPSKSGPDNYGTLPLMGTQQSQYHNSYNMTNYQSMAPVPSDFTLFNTSDNSHFGAQTSAGALSGPLFPASTDLGAVGGQFGIAEETLYDEPMDTEENVMEQYMNFDEETD